MSGKSAIGHNDQSAGLWRNDCYLSYLADDSQLNQFMKREFDSAYLLTGLLQNGDMGFVLSKPGQKQKNTQTHVTSPDKKDAAQKKLKILIAEDDEVSSQLLAIILKDIARELLYANNGEETIEACRNHQDIDLILMDIKMPAPDGIKSTQKIREFNKNVCIIAQTAHAMDGDKEIALHAGCNDYISKPIDKYILLEKIRKFF